MIQLLYKWTTGLFSGNICAQTITHERPFGIILLCIYSFCTHSLSNAAVANRSTLTKLFIAYKLGFFLGILSPNNQIIHMMLKMFYEDNKDF